MRIEVAGAPSMQYILVMVMGEELRDGGNTRYLLLFDTRSGNSPSLGQKKNVMVYSLQMTGNRRICLTQHALLSYLNLRAKRRGAKPLYSPCRKPDSMS